MKSTPKKQVRRISTTHATMIDQSLGLQMISVRLQKKLIDQLKQLAEDDGIGYQPLIRQILQRYVSGNFQKRSKGKLRDTQ